jgi:hypothetical protein
VWDSTERTYDAAGVILSRATTYDDGREALTTFTDGVRSTYLIEDLENVFTWDSIERTFDAAGVTLSQAIAYDDGSEVFTSYD